jgi:hypothetical protein
MNNFQTNITSAFFNGKNEEIVRAAVVDNTSNSYTTSEPYGAVLPKNIDVFSGLTTSILNIEDPEVAKQVKQVLLGLYLSLQSAIKHKEFSNYLSRIHLVQQDDHTALLEWNFQNFRVGFRLEPDKAESSCFVVSQDNDAGSYMANTWKLDSDPFPLVDRIVKYVLENT